MTIDPKRVKEIFLEAAELADEAARKAYLDKACGADAGVRERVEALLRSHDPEDSFLGTPAAVVPEPEGGATQAVTGIPVPSVAAVQTTDGENGSSHDEQLTFLDPPTRPDALGRLGHYEVLQVLGRGGFGIVFRAFDEMLQRVVALKVMAPQLAATSPARKRFLREARSSAQVRHENVVQVYEVAEQPLPYLAMEFIPGETLQQKLNRVGPLEVPEVLRIGRQIAEGLAAAHACDLIHRDIKPGNVLLEGGQHKVKITDFGLARAVDDASISQSSIIAGTPMYMAPEQAQGQTLDHRADLFSLGSVLYQMVAGRPPFRANTTVAVLKRVAEDKPRAIREIIPETPQWLCDIIAKLHAKNPEDRYQSARQVADVLADCEAQLKANAKLKDYSRIPRSKSQRTGRRKWVAAAAVVLPLIALAVLEFAGVTHLFRLSPPKKDVAQPGPVANASFDAKEAQEVSAKQLGIPVETINSIGMKLRLIPLGKFTMGSSKEEIDYWVKRSGNDWINEKLLGEGPRHEVEVTHPFYMGQTEVTVGQFRQFAQATGYQTQTGASHFGKMDAKKNWLNPGFSQTDDHPVVCVSWNDAVEFCNWLSKKEGKNYRLPTEAEWEYSCRAGSKGRWSFGDNEVELLNYARFLSNSQGHTWPVARLKQNAWGLHDMHGNVWEWCQDVYDANYYQNSPPRDPPGPGAGGERVQRGGAWCFQPGQCRSAFRVRNTPGARCDDDGFRVVLVVSPPAGVRTESGAKDKPASPVIAPFTDADVQRIAALPAAEQVEEVWKELVRRNPGFDGKVEHKIEDGVVTELKFSTLQVTDISPVRALAGLQSLIISNSRAKSSLDDLSPLKGLPLTSLSVGRCQVRDLTPLKEMPLTELSLWATPIQDLSPLKGMKLVRLDLNSCKQVRDLEPLKGMPLTALNLDYSQVRDLTPLKGMPLTYLALPACTQVQDLTPIKDMKLRFLNCAATSVSDLSPLKGMALQDIRLTPKNITRGLDILRDMKSLRTIGTWFDQFWPAAEFWERYDKGEFKQ